MHSILLKLQSQIQSLVSDWPLGQSVADDGISNFPHVNTKKKKEEEEEEEEEKESWIQIEVRNSSWVCIYMTFSCT
jgi:hypothetical protein